MSIKINDITPKSIAARTPIKVGDIIHSIDEQEVNDILDLMFYSQREIFTIKYSKPTGDLQVCQVKNTFDAPLGFEVDLAECQQCINQCIFCFVDQMPSGLRSSLYVKDDDFIYSFFYGNFITLTNLTEKDIQKIITQHISPLYVSVHTTNPDLHRQMLGYTINFDIKNTLQRLNVADIEMHCQIVLIPDVNDREELFKTLTDLVEMENISTIGIVPVGLTKYRTAPSVKAEQPTSAPPAPSGGGRGGGASLHSFTKKAATELISHIEFMKNMRKLDHIHLADEFFILAGLPIPEEHYYGNFDQIENGIGMIRKSWENWKYFKRRFIRALKNKSGNPVFVTSISGFAALNPILKDIQKSLSDKSIKATVIKNDFFGTQVTVTGLLAWQDISAQMKLADDEYPVFSSAIFNHQMYTLDDIHLDQIKTQLNRNIIIVDELFTDYTIISSPLVEGTGGGTLNSTPSTLKTTI